VHDPNTFSSEIGDVHERRAKRDSFSNEFRGASDSLLEDTRPPRPLEVGRRGRRIMAAIILVALVVGAGGSLFWYYSEDIGLWIAGLSAGSEDGGETGAEAEDEAEAEPPEESEPDKQFGIRGVPGEGEGEAGASTGEPAPAADTGADAEAKPPPEATPPASGGEATVEIASTQVRGKVWSKAVERKLEDADAALASCWKAEVAKGKAGPLELTVEFRIKWSGRRSGLQFTGGTPALDSCVSDAIGYGGWPEPRDGGEARVTRTWTLSS